jgi:hypothetical protein
MIAEAKSNCDKCGSPLHIQDVLKIVTEDDHERFIFNCSSCRGETIVKSMIFVSGHISLKYLETIKEHKDIISKEALEIISHHLENCAVCKDKYEEIFLEEASDNARLNRKLVSHFIQKSREIMKVLEKSEYRMGRDGLREFTFKGREYVLNQEDEFFRDSNNLHRLGRDRFKNNEFQNVFYFMREEEIITGIVSFLIFTDKVVLERISFRSREDFNKDKKILQEFRQDLKKGKFKLSAIQKYFNRIQGQS